MDAHKKSLALSEFQDRFRQAIVTGAEDQKLSTFLVHAERMDAYLGGYPARFEEVLREMYEAVYEIVGHHTGHELSHAYARRYPSTSYNINKIGAHMSDFLANEFAPAIKWPFLPDLAHFEFCQTESFHAELLPSVLQKDLADCFPTDLANAMFQFQPSVFVISSPYALLDIWKSKKKKRDRPTTVLIYRVEFDVRVAEIAKEEGNLIKLLQEGVTLSSAIEKVSELTEEKLSQSVANWMALGLIVAIKMANTK